MLSNVLLLLAGAAATIAVPATHPLIKRSYYTSDEGVEHTVVHDKETNAKLDFVTNSGVVSVLGTTQL